VIWTTQAPAKVNLDLRMRGRRADGYHLLETVLQSIALADTLTLQSRPGPFALTCCAPGVPTDTRNLAWKGAAAMALALETTLDGWELRLDKHVPAEAGLGGGSADAAAAARLVAAAQGRELDPAALADVIRPLGADVAFFAWGGTMRGVGVGDELTSLPDAPDATVILVRPPFGVSTRDAYGWYDADAGATSGTEPSDAAVLEPAADDTVHLDGCGNDLEAPVARRHPEIAAIVSRVRSAGARLAAMSGSGSACFGLFAPDADVSGLEASWRNGTVVWRTRLLSRAAHARATACRRLA